MAREVWLWAVLTREVLCELRGLDELAGLSRRFMPQKKEVRNFCSRFFWAKEQSIFSLLRTSLVVQWLRLHIPNAGGLGLIPGQGSRSHMLQLRIQNPKMGFSLNMDSIDQDHQKQLPSAVYQLLLLLSHFSCVRPKQLVLPFTQSDSEFPCESWMS